MSSLLSSLTNTLTNKLSMKNEPATPNFDLSTFAKAVRSEEPAKVAPNRNNLLACAGGPSDINITFGEEQLSRSLDGLEGRNLSRMVLGQPGGRESVLSFEERKAGSDSLADGDKVNLQAVIERARSNGAIAEDGMVGISAPVNGRQALELAIIARLTAMTIVANHSEGGIVRALPDGSHQRLQGQVTTSAGTRSGCAGDIYIAE